MRALQCRLHNFTRKFSKREKKNKIGTKFHFSSLFYVKMMCNLLFLEHDQLTC